LDYPQNTASGYNDNRISVPYYSDRHNQESELFHPNQDSEQILVSAYMPDKYVLNSDFYISLNGIDTCSFFSPSAHFQFGPHLTKYY
jgi:hypothetical protein